MKKKGSRHKKRRYLSQNEILAKLQQPKLKQLAKKKRKAYDHQQRLNELHAAE